MPTGRPPKPTALKILNGSAAHHPERRNPDEPQAEVLTVLPPVPEWLRDQVAREAWVEYGTLALGLGVLTAQDLPALAGTAAAFAEYLDSGDWHERDAAWKRWMAGLGRFGLSPSDRTRLHAAPKAKADPMAELIARRNQRKTS